LADSAAEDATPFLRVPKQRKFMGVQDRLAVIAAGRALDAAALLGADRDPERTGLYLAVGYIPFDREDIDSLLDASLEDGEFSIKRFSQDGIYAVHPHLTFRCLTNMPAFHISTNFDIQGPYFVTYPGPSQWYLALERACAALASGEVDVALVGAVAHQRNFLVEHHFRRIPDPVPSERLRDAAACVVLETLGAAEARSAPVRGRLLDWSLEYRPFHPWEEAPQHRESGRVAEEFGAVSLPCQLARAGPGVLRHTLESRDGMRASSAWEMR
jgi:3-oxoacyl-(acyl-carrier-protein) synthase